MVSGHQSGDKSGAKSVQNSLHVPGFDRDRIETGHQVSKDNS